MEVEKAIQKKTEVFGKTVGLEGLLLLSKTESERYAEQNGRMFQTTLEELCAFLGINILMGIHKLPKMRDYWSVDEGLGNTLILKTTTRDQFLDILQNLTRSPFNRLLNFTILL